jgi:hypothetical protein
MHADFRDRFLGTGVGRGCGDRGPSSATELQVRKRGGNLCGRVPLAIIGQAIIIGNVGRRD